jgi:hypothetical protein
MATSGSLQVDLHTLDQLVREFVALSNKAAQVWAFFFTNGFLPKEFKTLYKLFVFAHREIWAPSVHSLQNNSTSYLALSWVSFNKASYSECPSQGLAGRPFQTH